MRSATAIGTTRSPRFHRAAERNDRHRDEGGNHGHAGGEPEEGLAHVGRSEVFLEDEFQTIGHGLGESADGKSEVFFESQNTERNHGSVRADPVLNDG